VEHGPHAALAPGVREHRARLQVARVQETALLLFGRMPERAGPIGGLFLVIGEFDPFARSAAHARKHDQLRLNGGARRRPARPPANAAA
jgi:hypothetical protein